MNKYIHIGKVVATFGVGGEVILKHALGKKSSLKNIEALFLEERKDSYLPYFVTSSKIKTEDETYLKFDGIDSKEAAHRLITKPAWLVEEDFRKLAGKQSSIALLGYHIIDEETDIGEILEVIEQPHQVLLRIDLEGNEALIPLHEETLDNIDHKKKQVHVSLPDGLLDVYRNG
jgi:16S rRNA processing protein RimM